MILKLLLHFLTTVMLLCQDDFELNITFPNYCHAGVPG